MNRTLCGNVRALAFLTLLGVVGLTLASMGQAAPAEWIQLRNDSGTAEGYNTGMAEGYVVGAVLQGGDELFPIAVHSVQALFYRNFPYADPTAYVRAVVYRVGPDGRPAERLGESPPVTITTFYPTWVSLSLSEPVFLTEPQPFLAGIEYLDGVKGSTPCVLTDDSANIPIGKSFYSRDGGRSWIEHYDFWLNPQAVGYDMIRATVEAHAVPPSGTSTATYTPSPTPTVTLTPWPTPTEGPPPNALWPGIPIGYGKQHSMARGPDGRLHLVYFNPDGRSLVYAWSDNNGRTWQPALEERIPFYVFDQPGGSGSLGVDSDGLGLHLVIGQDLSTTPDGGINGALYFRFRDGRWSAPERIASGGFGYNLAVGPDGRVHVAWSDSDIWYRVRYPDGTWARARRLVTNGWHPDIDVGPGGRIHVAYNSNNFCCDATWVEVYYLRSDDNGQTWFGPERVTFDNVWSGCVVGAADPQGRYHLLYLTFSGVGGSLYYRSRGANGIWTPPQLLYHGIPTGQTGAESPSLQADEAGNLVALFYCLVPGQPTTVCLQARDAQIGWLDPRRLAIYGAAAPSMADGRLNPQWVDLLWSSAGYLVYRGISDLVFQPTPTPTPTPTTTPAPYHVRVVDEAGQPQSGVRIYRNGSFVGFTRSDGVLNFQLLDAGDELIALAPLPLDAAATSGRTERSEHDRDLDTGDLVEPWAFRVFLTNLPQSPEIGPLPPGLLPDGNPGERRLVVRRDSPLILLNLTVSIEWDADQEYLDELETGLRRASSFLYDVSDGQMALGRVTIFDRGEHWEDADIRIAANNLIFPHAAVAGISSGRPDWDVRLGPLWNGHSARRTHEGDGPWSRPAGYRTIVHELGHYVLGLYDEYVRYVLRDGVLLDEDAYCTHPEQATPAPLEPNRASIMYNQHLASELADRLLSFLWSEACARTEQWDRTGGESDWDTFLRRFRAADGPATLQCEPGASIPATYCLWRPGSRGQVIPQPTPDPPVQRVWPWPVVDRRASPEGPPRRELYVQWVGPPQPNRSYALRTVVQQLMDGRLTYTEQGFTGPDGRIEIFGAQEGATLWLNTLDRSVQVHVPVSSSRIITLTLNRPTSLAADVASTPLQLRLSPQADGQGVHIEVMGAAQDELWAEYTLPGREPERLRLTPAGDVLVATLPMDLRFQASGTVTILGADGQPMGPHLSATFSGRGLAAPAPADLFSADGRLWLHLPEGRVTQDTFVVVSRFGALPGGWLEGWVPAGPAYAVSYPPGQPAPIGRVRIRLDPGQWTAQPLGELVLLARTEGGGNWMPLAVAYDEEQGSVSAEWGGGMLVAAWPAPAMEKIYLPLIWR
jgi:hypothetical protein